MLIVQQIVAFVLGAFSVCFMLWFLANTLRDSRSRNRRHAHPPIAESESWQFKAIKPQVPSTAMRAPHTADKAAPRPQHQPAPHFAPALGQSSRSLRSASR